MKDIVEDLMLPSHSWLPLPVLGGTIASSKFAKGEEKSLQNNHPNNHHLCQIKATCSGALTLLEDPVPHPGFTVVVAHGVGVGFFWGSPLQ